MPRLRRFESHRFVGARDTMKVYDCDIDEHADLLESRVSSDGLFDRNLLQTFAPDELAEARNRGFSPVR
jgi:hypothetical protein